MNYKLSHLAQIISGYSFRGAIHGAKNGNYRVIRVRDIEPTSPIDSSLNLLPVNFKNTNTDAIVQKKDVLLSTRGTEITGLKVGMYNGKKNNIIATSSLFILRTNTEKIIPEYLLYYLNSRHGQNNLKNLMSGAVIKTLLKKEINDLKIPVPPIEKQKLLVRTISNIFEQTKLMQKKIKLLNSLTENILLK